MDEPYLLAAARYVELNPVRAGLGRDAADWRWSSARAHLSGHDDALVRVAPLLAMVADWRGFLDSAIPEEQLRDLREHARTGYPLGNATFLERLERIVGRRLRPGKPGRPSRLPRRP
jgi:putative transposase